MGRSLAGATILMSGGSRGIGLAIAKRAALDGANIVLLAKTGQPHPRLQGTVHTAVAEIEQTGGQAVAVVGDVRNDDDVTRAVQTAVESFGGVDIVINNASAIDLRPTTQIDMKKYDLMMDINVRGAFQLSRLAVPHLRRSANPHILTMSPPLNLRPRWFSEHLPYTMSKYAMSFLTLGLAEELRPDGIAVNALWPRTLIATAAVSNVVGDADTTMRSRDPRIMADAAYALLTEDPARSGRFTLDEDVLRENGVTDFDGYRVGPGDTPLELDLFVDPPAS